MATVQTEVDVDVDFDLVREETEDSELIQELEDRGYYVAKIITTGYESMIGLPKYKLRECLQDSFELNHHVSDEVLLETIKNALK